MVMSHAFWFFMQVIHLCKSWLFYFNQFIMLHHFNVFHSQSILTVPIRCIFFDLKGKIFFKTAELPIDCNPSFR